MKKVWMLPVAAIAILVPFLAFAQAAAPVDIGTWIGQLASTISQFVSSNVTWQVKAAAVIALIISSMNVTVLNQWVWQKIPSSLQIWFAPLLGLVAGILGVLNGGSWSDVLPYVVAGGGAVFVHELLSMIAAIPGLGPMWVSLINIIENIPVIGTQSAKKSPTKTS